MDQISMEQVRATYKVRDSWWTVLLIDPIAGRLVRAAATRPWITPNRLTAVAFLLGLGAAGAFLAGSPVWLVVGVALYYAGFVIDCMDGKIARLLGTGSIFGSWLDFFLDRIRVVLCVAALFAGQFLRTDAPAFLFVAMAVVFLALFGYVNGAQTDQARAKLVEAGRVAPDNAALLGTATGPAAGLAGQIQALLHRNRIRMNLVSGIEFEMAVLVISPLVAALTGPFAVIWVTVAAGALLIMFELALIFRFWLATRANSTSRSDPTRTPTPR